MHMTFAKAVVVRNNKDFIKTVPSICCKKYDNEAPINSKVKWLIKDANGKPYEYGTPAECNCHLGGVRHKYMTKVQDVEDINAAKIYHPCWNNNIAAICRMCMQVPYPEKNKLEEFKRWFDKIKVMEIEPIIENTVIDHIAWFNHLTADKQNEVKRFYMDTEDGTQIIPDRKDIPEMCTYTNFVKSEKQFGAAPKTRCICSPNAMYKYVCGPVTYALEQSFKKSFKGYKVPLTWNEQENMIDYYESIGLDSTIQLDGKFFDLTQKDELKFIDRAIYDMILDKVEHVEPKIFREVVVPKERTVRPNCIIDKKVVTYGKVIIPGETFSGSCDTTLMNTIRMSCYVRFAIESQFPQAEYQLWVKGDDTVIFCGCDVTSNIKDAIYKVFVTEEQWKREPEINYGLGQVAKFVKVGSLIDFDFCSTMCIKTNNGYKILRKLTNIVDKEHYSVKIAQTNPSAYHNDLLISAMSWLGYNDTILSKYFKFIHPYTPNVKPIAKKGKDKMRLEGSKIKYEDNYIHYDYYIQDERISFKNFTDNDLWNSLTAMVDNEQFQALLVLEDRLNSNIENQD